MVMVEPRELCFSREMAQSGHFCSSRFHSFKISSVSLDLSSFK